MAAARVRKQAALSPAFKFAAARLIGEPVEGTREARDCGDAEGHAADQVDDDSHQPEWPRSGAQPMRHRGAVGDQDQGKEANRAESVCRSRVHLMRIPCEHLWPGEFLLGRGQPP